MTILVKERDLVDGSAFAWSSTDGVTLNRAFIVTGIEGNASAKSWLAANADGIPKQRDEHPDVIGSYVTNKTVNMKGAETAEVIVEYAPFKTGEGDEDNAEQAYRTKRISGSVQSVDTNIALDVVTGEEFIMNVSYDWSDGKSPTGITPDVQAGTVRKEQALVVMEISQTENEDPFDKILEYQGTVNLLPWAKGAHRTWLCREISSSTNDNGETFTVTYRFQYKSDNWLVWVAYIDDRTGKPPEDVGQRKGNGGLDQTDARKVFNIYEQKDFRKLKIGG
jgi:hypothetical protein